MARGQFLERVIIVVKAVTDKATSEFHKLEQSVDAADRAALKNMSTTEKLGAAWKGMGTAAQASAMLAAAKAATKLALEYDKAAASTAGFAKRMGISIDTASRWNVVADDMGVSTQSIETAMKRTSIQVEKNAAAFDKWGVQVQTTADGNVDLNETFLNMIDAVRGIEDPTKRSAAAFELLGRQGGDVLLKMASSTKDWRAELEGVSSLQVFDKNDAAQAMETKAAVNDLKNAWAGLRNVLGELLAGPIGDVIEALAMLGNVIVRVLEPLMALRDGLKAILPDFLENTSVIGMATDAVGWLGDKFRDLTGRNDEAKEATEKTTGSIQDQTAAVDELNKAIETVTGAVLGAFEAEGRYQDALEKMNKTLADKNESTREQAESIVDAAKASVKMSEAQAKEAGATYDAAQKQADLIAALNKLSANAAPAAQQEIQDLINRLNGLPPTKTVNVDVVTNYKTTGTPTPQSAGVRAGRSSPVVINMRGTSTGRLRMARDVEAALRAARRWGA